MKIPKVKTTNGWKLLTVLPNEALVTGYLSAAADAEESDLVQLLQIAEPVQKKAGAFLRQCMTKGAKLVTVYPANGDKAPKGAQLIGSIPDGALYIV